MVKVSKRGFYQKKYDKKTFELAGQGSESKVWKVKHKKKIFVVKRFNKKSKIPKLQLLEIQKKYLAQKIANLLYPWNVAKPLEFDQKRRRIISEYRAPDAILEIMQLAATRERRINKIIKRSKEKKRSEKLTSLEKEDEYYKNLLFKLYNETEKRKNLTSVKSLIRRLKKAGLEFDETMTNIGIKNQDQPVVYEFESVKSKKLKAYIKTRELSKQNKEEILKLLDKYEKVSFHWNAEYKKQW